MKRYERERKARIKERREAYEFSPETKRGVSKRANGYCEKCKSRKGAQFHHIISIEIAIEYGYPPERINSPDNCLYACETCHEELDKDN